MQISELLVLTKCFYHPTYVWVLFLFVKLAYLSFRPGLQLQTFQSVGQVLVKNSQDAAWCGQVGGTFLEEGISQMSTWMICSYTAQSSVTYSVVWCVVSSWLVVADWGVLPDYLARGRQGERERNSWESSLEYHVYVVILITQQKIKFLFIKYVYIKLLSVVDKDPLQTYWVTWSNF